MTAFLKALRARKPLPEIEANIARLGEELPLTVAFASVMERHGYGRAATAAIDDQRERLARAERRMTRSLYATRRHRVHAALAGVAAALVLASGSFAAIRVIAPSRPANDELIRRATVKLDLATQADSAESLAALVHDVHTSILALPQDALTDPAIRLQVQTMLGKEQALLSRTSNTAGLLAQLQRLADKVQIDPPQSQPKEQPPAPKPADSTAPSAPQAPPGP